MSLTKPEGDQESLEKKKKKRPKNHKLRANDTVALEDFRKKALEKKIYKIRMKEK